MGERDAEHPGGHTETCQETIQPSLRSLRTALRELRDWRASEEKRRLQYLERSEAERRRVEAEFERLRRLLAEKEREALGRLLELDAAFEAAQVEKSSRVTEAIAQLQALIEQLEAKHLPQDLGSLVSSWSSGLPAELEKSLSSCRRHRDALQEALKEFREEKTKAPPEPGAAPLPQLLADRKSVRWDGEGWDEAVEPPRGQEEGPRREVTR